MGGHEDAPAALPNFGCSWKKHLGWVRGGTTWLGGFASRGSPGGPECAVSPQELERQEQPGWGKGPAKAAGQKERRPWVGFPPRRA